VVRLWGRDDRFALKDAAIAAALDRSLHADGQSHAGAPGPIEIGVDLKVSPAEALVWFCDPQRWTRFQGRQAWLDPRPGGQLRVDLGNGVMIRGHYVEVDERHVAFTWGKEGDPTLPSESTEVTVTAVPRPDGCALILRHIGLPDQAQSEAHRSGWRYHLLRLAVAANGATGDTEVIDLFLAACSEPDRTARQGLLERACAPDFEYSDGRTNDFGVGPVSTQLGRLIEAGLRKARVGPIDRRGGLIRCRFAVRRADDDDLAPPVDLGDLVVAIDAQKLTAVSFFDVLPATASANPAPAAPADADANPWRDAPSTAPAARPRRGW
jgi:uncharacterized protein YndB with AHSA1/START domain